MKETECCARVPGNTTYLAADAAYHKDKYSRNFDGFVTIWGADHHGQVPGLRAAVQALGNDSRQNGDHSHSNRQSL